MGSRWDTIAAGMSDLVAKWVRQADLGRGCLASTIGMARRLEDARIRLRLYHFERLIGEGDGPFQIQLVGQRVSRLAPAGPAGARVQVRTGVRRVGRSSVTSGQPPDRRSWSAANVWAMAMRLWCRPTTRGRSQLPYELIADLDEMQLPETCMAGRPAATRLRPERLHRAHYSNWVPLRSRIGDVTSTPTSMSTSSHWRLGTRRPSPHSPWTRSGRLLGPGAGSAALGGADPVSR